MLLYFSHKLATSSETIRLLLRDFINDAQTSNLWLEGVTDIEDSWTIYYEAHKYTTREEL